MSKSNAAKPAKSAANMSKTFLASVFVIGVALSLLSLFVKPVEVGNRICPVEGRYQMIEPVYERGFPIRYYNSGVSEECKKAVQGISDAPDSAIFILKFTLNTAVWVGITGVTALLIRQVRVRQ